MPTTPQAAAGSRIEPPVSEPSAPNVMRAATEAPEPLDEPPVTLVSSQGFLALP
jgi:hypothetical protein